MERVLFWSLKVAVRSLAAWRRKVLIAALKPRGALFYGLRYWLDLCDFGNRRVDLGGFKALFQPTADIDPIGEVRNSCGPNLALCASARRPAHVGRQTW